MFLPYISDNYAHHHHQRNKHNNHSLLRSISSKHILITSIIVFTILLMTYIVFIKDYDSNQEHLYRNRNQHSSDIHSKLELESVLEEIRTYALQYINIVDNPPCFIYLYSPFLPKRLDQSYKGQCYDQNWLHTEWNSEIQQFTMQCSNKNHIPMYYVSSEYIFNNPEKNNKHWKLYPNSEIVTLHKSIHLDPPEIPISTKGVSVINTACVDIVKGVAYHNYFVQQIRNETLVEERKAVLSESMEENSMSKPPVNIHIILVDGVSHDFFFRHFPHSSKVLEEMKQMKDPGFQILDFENTHVLGYNSVPNMFAFTTGEPLTDPYFTDADYQNLIRKTHNTSAPDYTPFIWDYMRNYGYVTSAGEDAGESGIATIYGYQNSHRSYDSYPLFHSVSYRVNHDQGYFFNYNPRVCPCAGHRFMSDIVFDWVRSHSNAYNDIPNFIMAVNHEAHDAVGNQIVTLDPNLAKQLQWYVNSGRLKDTVLVIMSDHGIHYGMMYLNDDMAKREQQNPFMMVIAPDHLVTDTLKQNTKRLVNLKDLHMTLIDFASFPQKGSQHRMKPYAMSLLHNVVPEDRTCYDMRVPEDYSSNCERKGYPE
jgi:hypothetical protein